MQGGTIVSSRPTHEVTLIIVDMKSSVRQDDWNALVDVDSRHWSLKSVDHFSHIHDRATSRWHADPGHSLIKISIRFVKQSKPYSLGLGDAARDGRK